MTYFRGVFFVKEPTMNHHCTLFPYFSKSVTVTPVPHPPNPPPHGSEKTLKRESIGFSCDVRFIFVSRTVRFVEVLFRGWRHMTDLVVGRVLWTSLLVKNPICDKWFSIWLSRKFSVLPRIFTLKLCRSLLVSHKLKDSTKVSLSTLRCL